MRITLEVSSSLLNTTAFYTSTLSPDSHRFIMGKSVKERMCKYPKLIYKVQDRLEQLRAKDFGQWKRRNLPKTDDLNFTLNQAVKKRPKEDIGRKHLRHPLY